jgi:hypothetical protein
MSKRTLPVMKRRLFAIAAAGVLTVAALAGGVGYAAIPDAGTRMYHACMLRNVQTIRIIDPALPPSSPLQHCTSLETEITFNQKGEKGDPGAPGQPGQNGKDGQSVTNAVEDRGANCPNGGSRFTAGAGLATFACNGRDGKDGKDGNDGVDGASVTTAPEPAGSNCATGGARFTAANGVTYACNGKDGTNGTDGAQGPQGNPGLVFRGEWSQVGDYLPGSVVTRDGSSWVNTEYACCGSEPGVSGDWNLLAAKGDQGPAGPDKQFTDRNTFYSATVHSSAEVTFANGEGAATANCGQNEIVAGGGYSRSSDPFIVVTDARPGGNGWYVHAWGQDGDKVTAYVVCLEPHLQITVQ